VFLSDTHVEEVNNPGVNSELIVSGGDHSMPMKQISRMCVGTGPDTCGDLAI
jgi:hypothetical protein